MVLNKRGQGLSTNAIILIILGVIVLVILAVGFMTGWKFLKENVSKDNVETIVNQCKNACLTSSVYGFCTQPRTLEADSTILPPDGTATDNCKNFGSDSKYSGFGFPLCSTIVCPEQESEESSE